MKSTKISTSSGSDSLYQSDDLLSSSPSAQDLFKLQKEILEQSRSIEDYIKTHQKNVTNGQNDSFSVLETLLSLFKLEVSMNLSFRKAIVNERNIRLNLEGQVKKTDEFFQEFSRIINGSNPNSPVKINCFEDVYNYVINSNDKYMKSKKKMKSTIVTNQDQINNFQKIISEKEEEMKTYQNNQNQYEDIINKLKTKLTSNKTQIESLKSELEQTNEIIRKQRLAIKEQKCASSNDQISSQKELDEIKQQFEQELNDCQEKTHLQRKKCHTQQIALKDLSNQMKKKDEIFQNKENLYQCKISELQGQVQKLQSENQNQSLMIQSDTKKIDYLKNQISELENKLSNTQKVVEKYETQIVTLKAQNENMKSCFQNCQKKYEMKINSYKAEHRHQINALHSDFEISVEKKMRDIKQELCMKDEEINMAKAELQSANLQIAELVKKLKKLEKKRENEFKCTDDLRIENERLRNMMRDKSDSNKGAEAVLNDFRRIQDVLGLGPNASSKDVFDTIMAIVYKNDGNRRSHHY